MESKPTMHVTRLIGNLGLLVAIFACLVLWGGIVMLIEDPSHSHLSTHPTAGGTPVLPKPSVFQWESASEAHQSLTDLMLFWLPLGLGAIACGAGIITLTGVRGRHPDIAHRALIALILGIIPGCLCALWISALIVLPFLGR